MSPVVHVMAGLVWSIARSRMPWRRGLRACIAACAGAIAAVACLAVAAAAPAGQREISGSWFGDSPGLPNTVTLVVANGVVTAFAAGALVPCPGSTSVTGATETEPISITLAHRVRTSTTKLAFTIPVTGRDYAGSAVVSGSLERAGDIRGTIHTTLRGLHGRGNCAGTEPFEIVAANRPGVPDGAADWQQLVGHPYLTYRDYEVTGLYAAIAITCPNGHYYPFVLSSKARGLDPIHVSQSGHFQISGLAPMDGYGYIVHYTLIGVITLTGASGTMTTTMTPFPGGQTCAPRTAHWATKWKPPTQPTPKPKSQSSPPQSGFASPRPGVWTFYVKVEQSTFREYPDDMDAAPLTTGDGGVLIHNACGARCVTVAYPLPVAPGAFALHQDGNRWIATVTGTARCDPAMGTSVPPSKVTMQWTMYFTNGGRTIWGQITAADSTGCEPGHATAIVTGSWQSTP